MGKTTDFYAPDKANIERLRIILTEQSGAEVTLEDAEEIGIQLLSFYECLARERGSAKASGDVHVP